MKTAPGKTILLVVGIIYLVFGGFGILGAAGGLATAGYWDEVLPFASGLSWSVYYGIAFVGALLFILFGLMGILNRAKLEKAGLLRVFAIIGILYAVVDSVLSFSLFTGVLGGAMAVISLIFGLVLPVLYLVGAQKNLAAYKESEPTL